MANEGTATARPEVSGGTLRVVLADALLPEGVELLAAREELVVVDCSGGSREELEEALREAHGLIVRSTTTVDEGLLEAAPRLKVVGRAGVGVDNIDVEAATRRGIAVLNAPGGNTLSTAELTFGLLLAAARRIPRADRSVREGRWERGAFRGIQLQGRTLGVVGLGRIGSAVAHRARGFGMEVLAHDPYAPPERADELGAELTDLADLLERADFVTLHAPLTEATRDLIGEEELARMKPRSVLVNAARGGLVEERALADALRQGRLAGAALDVFRVEPLPEDSPLRDAPNLVMTPHLGAATGQAKREVAREICAGVRDALLAGDLRAALNAPRIDPAQRGRVEALLELARRLGLVLSVLTDGRCRRLHVRYAGDLSEVLRPVSAATLEGYLGPSVDRPLNVVNAHYLAAERGIEVARVRTGDEDGYPQYLELVAENGDGAHTVGGALFGDGHPRLVRIDDFMVEAVPRGTMLVIRNRDVPGVIGEVGSRLAAAGLNIAGYHQARRTEGGDALAVVTVDGVVEEVVLETLRALPDVESVRRIRFAD